jgi:hypothetical protein
MFATLAIFTAPVYAVAVSKATFTTPIDVTVDGIGRCDSIENLQLEGRIVTVVEFRVLELVPGAPVSTLYKVQPPFKTTGRETGEKFVPWEEPVRRTIRLLNGTGTDTFTGKWKIYLRR